MRMQAHVYCDRPLKAPPTHSGNFLARESLGCCQGKQNRQAWASRIGGYIHGEVHTRRLEHCPVLPFHTRPIAGHEPGSISNRPSRSLPFPVPFRIVLAHNWAHGAYSTTNYPVFSWPSDDESNNFSGCRARPAPCSRARNHRKRRSRGNRTHRPMRNTGIDTSLTDHRVILFAET